MALGDRRELVLDRVGEHGAGRVGRVAEEQRLGPWRDRPPRPRPGRARSHPRNGSGRAPDVPPANTMAGTYATYEGSWRMTSSPGSQVARRARSTASEAPDGDKDLGRRVVADAVAPFEVAGERPPQLERAVVGGVVGPALAQRLDARLDDDPRGVEVGLPHPEADDVVHRREDVEEAADPGRRHGADALGERALSQGSAGRGDGLVHGHGRSLRHRVEDRPIAMLATGRSVGRVLRSQRRPASGSMAPGAGSVVAVPASGTVTAARGGPAPALGPLAQAESSGAASSRTRRSRRSASRTGRPGCRRRTRHGTAR